MTKLFERHSDFFKKWKMLLDFSVLEEEYLQTESIYKWKWHWMNGFSIQHVNKWQFIKYTRWKINEDYFGFPIMPKRDKSLKLLVIATLSPFNS